VPPAQLGLARPGLARPGLARPGLARPARWCRATALLGKRFLATLIIGVATLGAATLFVMNTEPDQHRSDPPVVPMIATYDQARHPGGPLSRDEPSFRRPGG